MRVLGLIPARGGSKGVPRKNIYLVAGKPLLQYTAQAALAARRLDRVVLSTEDEEIAKLGACSGLEVPFLRPTELAQDTTPMLPVVQHAVRALEIAGDHFDAICLLQPTSPLRRASDIDEAVGLLERTRADSVISFVEVGHWHPAHMKYLTDDGRVIHPPFADEVEGRRRQDLRKLYLSDGSIYLTRTAVVMERNSLQGDHCQALLIKQERACDIDTPFDLFIAEQLLKRELRDRMPLKKPDRRSLGGNTASGKNISCSPRKEHEA
jgi:CMP-N,N'-diacetyllegionaminic acid synthase